MQNHELTVLEKVRRAIGRDKPLAQPPVPPAIDEPITRLVHTDIGLPELFAKRATEMKMKLATVSADELMSGLIAFLRESNCKKIAVSISPLLERLNIATALRAAGFDTQTWDELTLDQVYDGYDCAVTDVAWAVAETGSLVIRPDAGQGRGLSLVPIIHVAIVEPRNLVPDLVDLMEKLSHDPTARSNIILITGPSKTADIEMNVVTGVHGPNIVKVFLLQ
jgi:L-lactate dehydrogenase complex protein LldG